MWERFGSAFPLHAAQLSRDVPADPVSFLPAPPAKRLVPRYVGLSGNTGGHTSNVIKPVATNEAGLDSLLRTSLVQRAATIGPSYVRPDIFFLIWLPGHAALLLLSGRRCLGALGFLKISLENNRLHATPESQGDAHWKLITPVHN